ncbi:hypothetical protein PAXRUDRAFT_163801 [Paxillus rubicundulus Ve08.2h10]|uniref:Reverse transcriptase zinc-binding domain-containing protein n=1 Tax=Paxillus rubicundulus Ve08.2h10 TaxID=930991 RepID=A0A0D0DCY9_9AGAM|nr:hypothetical protein PAXRUDRAFT_163801 [Paxillus rubicundulus Ve08.2h10]
MFSGSFTKLALTLTCRHTSILIWLCMKHTPLNAHLNKIKKVDMPHCPHCPGLKEDIAHYILKCPQYVQECFVLARALGRKAHHLPHLLLDSKAVPYLINYMNSTSRLKTTYGEVPNT